MVSPSAERGWDCAGLTGSCAAALIAELCAGIDSLLLAKPRGRRPSAGHSRAAGALRRGWLACAVSATADLSVAAP